MRGQESAEGGDHGSVVPVDPRPWYASLEHGQLMAQDEDLDLLAVSEWVWSTIQLSSFMNIW
jgi:hypothetical protein